MKRKLSPRELTHLARFGKPQTKSQDIGEMPVEYVTGKAEFYGRVFDVDENVLIPRVETEDLVDLVLEEHENFLSPSPLAIADIGCGAGPIGLTLALELEKKVKSAKIYLADVSKTAVEVAKKNALNLGTTRLENIEVELLVSDLCENLPKNVKFDILIANLPYIPAQRVQNLDPSVKDFEPHLALDGGPEGLSLIYKFLDQASLILSTKGVIFLEIDHTHTLQDFLQYKNRFKIELFQDEFGQNRFVRLETK